MATSLGLERYPSDKSKWRFGSHAISISANKGLFNDWHAHKGGSGAIDLVLHVNEDWDFEQAVIKRQVQSVSRQLYRRA